MTDALPVLATFVVKVASRCNMACSYCYVYEHADQSWVDQPRYLSRDLVDKLAVRLQEFKTDSGADCFLVVLHGGEPLLYGRERTRYFVETIREALPDVELRFGMQSNGLLVDEPWVELFQELGIRVGLSLDGLEESHDRYRRDKADQPTFSRTLAAFNLLHRPTAGESVFGGFLSVLDIERSPRDTLDFFDELGTPYLDFLLPNINHDTVRLHPHRITDYRRWLIDAFDIWFDEKPNLVIRQFHLILKLLLGGRRGMDTLGVDGSGVVVIECDGSYHVLDALKTSFDGATATGLTIVDSPVAALLSNEIFSYLRDKTLLSAGQCATCSNFEICGGGYLPHRYSRRDQFARESVYCDALMALIDHARQRLSELDPALTGEA